MSDLYVALRSAYSALEAAHETFKDILAGKAMLRAEEWAVIKPINEDALQRAADAMQEFDVTRYAAEQPLAITRIIRGGEVLHEDAANCELTVQDLYVAAGRLLDKAQSHEILGDVLVVAANGKTYAMTVEACLAEADADYVEEILAEGTAAAEE